MVEFTQDVGLYNVNFLKFGKAESCPGLNIFPHVSKEFGVFLIYFLKT